MAVDLNDVHLQVAKRYLHISGPVEAALADYRILDSEDGTVQRRDFCMRLSLVGDSLVVEVVGDNLAVEDSYDYLASSVDCSAGSGIHSCLLEVAEVDRAGSCVGLALDVCVLAGVVVVGTEDRRTCHVGAELHWHAVVGVGHTAAVRGILHYGALAVVVSGSLDFPHILRSHFVHSPDHSLVHSLDHTAVRSPDHNPGRILARNLGLHSDRKSVVEAAHMLVARALAQALAGCFHSSHAKEADMAHSSCMPWLL